MRYSTRVKESRGARSIRARVVQAACPSPRGRRGHRKRRLLRGVSTVYVMYCLLPSLK